MPFENEEGCDFHISVDALAGQSDDFLVSLFPNTICHIFVLQMASAFLQCVFSRPILLAPTGALDDGLLSIYPATFSDFHSVP